MKKLHAVIYKDKYGKVYQFRITDGNTMTTVPCVNRTEAEVKRAIRKNYPPSVVWISQEIE